MPQPAKRRVLGSLRRLLRRRRIPRPGEQEWLRLILLVRKLQNGQLALLRRFDELRGLSSSMSAFRGEFAELESLLESARESAGALEHNLGEKLAGLVSPGADATAALDPRIERLDALSERLETLAAASPTELPFAAEVGTTLAEMKVIAARFEAAVQAEGASAGQDELAALYARIEELAESLARPAGAESDAAPIAELLARLDERLAGLAGAERAPGGGESAAPSDVIERLERLAERLELAAPAHAPALPDTEFYVRLERLAERLEQTPMALADLPDGALVEDERTSALAREIEELRALMNCELEARRRVDAELEGLKVQLRSSELARVELETRHSSELTQVADHAQRQVARIEDDLKKKRRGLAELTQQNIRLQTELGRLTKELAARDGAQAPASAPSVPVDEPRAALPKGGSVPMAKVMRGPEPTGEPPGDRSGG